MSARHELYVYYRVTAPHWREAADVVLAWQLQLSLAQVGLAARVLRRPEERDDQVTLMETYAVAGGIDDALRDVLVRGAPALQPWLRGQRHVEPFEPLA